MSDTYLQRAQLCKHSSPAVIAKLTSGLPFSPPSTWFLPNFSVLFGLALMPFLWWTTIFTILTTLWQDIYKWSAISVALRM